MAAHCDCSEQEREPVIIEEEITHGAPDGTVSRRKECTNCWGLIKVLC
jgi:hypothetical protein